MLLIADNLQLTRPTVDREFAAGNTAALGRRIAKLVAAGAEAIDINTGPPGRRAAGRMVELLETATAATDRHLLLDTLDSSALHAALAHGAANRMLLVNMDHTRSVEMVRTCRMILNDSIFAWQPADARDG